MSENKNNKAKLDENELDQVAGGKIINVTSNSQEYTPETQAMSNEADPVSGVQKSVGENDAT